jgi:hypothetical protein
MDNMSNCQRKLMVRKSFADAAPWTARKGRKSAPGNLYRFACSGALTDNPAFRQIFEGVWVIGAVMVEAVYACSNVYTCR